MLVKPVYIGDIMIGDTCPGYRLDMHDTMKCINMISGMYSFMLVYTLIYFKYSDGILWDIFEQYIIGKKIQFRIQSYAVHDHPIIHHRIITLQKQGGSI